MNMLLYGAIVTADSLLQHGVSMQYMLLKPALVYAQAALMFYMLHFYLLIPFYFLPKMSEWASLLTAFGLGYPCVLTILFFICKRYGGFKRTTRPDSVYRLF